jgi:hypothetical protein
MHKVLDEDYLSKRIIIDNVIHYAYGQHDDGEIGIWVAGQAGWFSISPAKGYRPVYNDMVEAIDLLYFLVDRHQRKRPGRRSWNPSFEYLCDEVRPLNPRLVKDLGFNQTCFLFHSTSVIRMAFSKMVTIRQKYSIGTTTFCFRR